MGAHIPAELRRLVRAHFAECCAYCHTAEALTVIVFEVEHIVPRVAGGETVFENLCLACPICNRHKATRQKADDPGSGERVFLFHPHRQVWAEHFTWNVEFTRLIGLTATGRATVEALHMNRPQIVRARQIWVKMNEHPPRWDE